MLHLANREARREQGLLNHPLAAKSVEAALVDGLLLAQPHNYSDDLLHDTRVAPPRAVREAVELLETCPDRGWSAPVLATTFMCASGPCGRDSGGPSTPHRCATFARCDCGKYVRTFWRHAPTPQRSAQSFAAGAFSIRAGSRFRVERSSANPVGHLAQELSVPSRFTTRLAQDADTLSTLGALSSAPAARLFERMAAGPAIAQTRQRHLDAAPDGLGEIRACCSAVC
jgi:hypothetical protein